MRAPYPCARLPAAGQRAAGGLPAAGRGRRGRQGLPGAAGRQGPSAPWPGDPACSVVARWHRWACNAPFPSTSSSPAPQLARQAWSRPWGWPPGTPGPARCSLLLTVALSFLSSVHAVPPGTGRPRHLRSDICQRWAPCPPILLGEFPQGLGLLPGMLPSFLDSRDPALFSPTVLCRWPFGMEMPTGGNFWLLHSCCPAHNPAGRPEGEDLKGTGSLVPAEACTGFAWAQRKQSRPFQPSPEQSPTSADEPHLPGSSAECEAAVPAPCTLPGEVGPAAEAPSPPLMGAALLFPALLCLWREGSYHQLRGDRL